MRPFHVWVVGLSILCGVAVQADDSLRTANNDAFGPGESFEFSIGYGLVEAGTARMEVKGAVTVEGRPALHIVSTATSNRFFDGFYRVRDTVSTWMDAQGLFPWRFEQHQREGDYVRQQEIRFDPRASVVHFRDEQFETPRYIQDILSAFYYVRTLALAPGDTVELPHWSERKFYTLRVIVHDVEAIETEAGEFDCVKLEPMLASEGLFRHEGKVFIWVTNDRLHMPVLVRSRLMVGAIEAELVAYRLGDLLEW